MTGLTLRSEVPARLAGANHVERSGRLGLGALAAYGAGSTVQDIIQYGLNTLLLFYLTIVCGLSGSAAGLALGVALVVDAFVDPLVGSLSDNSRSRHGRRHPWMAASAIPIALAFLMLFSIPAGLTGPGLFAWALVALLAVRIGLSGFTVPYIALGAELSDDYAERSVIVAARVLFSVAAPIIGAFLAFGVFMKGVGGQTHRDAYPPFAFGCGVVVLLAAAVSTLGTLRSRGRLHAAPPAKGAVLGRLAAEVVEVFRNPSFRTLFLACLILFVGLGAATSLTLHANTYFWKLPSRAILIITYAYAAGLLVGVFFAGFLGRLLEKRTIALFGVGLIGLCQLLPAALKVAGLIPPAAYVPVLMLSHGLVGVGASASLIGFQSMMADAADEHEHLFGARREGLYFAGISLSAKASSGVGALIAGLVLDIIGFPHGLGPGAAAAHAIPAEAVRNLGLLYGPGASVITGLSVATLLGYRRGRADHARIRDALDRRRAG
ncbi:MAG: major facilitator superfamily 1 [Caulobacteraceae bacterium]|nr:major facilitator superfamily 1 [Caulobacteraceae bacterium]